MSFNPDATALVAVGKAKVCVFDVAEGIRTRAGLQPRILYETRDGFAFGDSSEEDSEEEEEGDEEMAIEEPEVEVLEAPGV